MNLDVQNILNRYSIDNTVDHKNVTEKCVGVSPCPECGDTDFHCGIFLETGRYTCWKCKTSGSLYRLLKILSNVSFREYETLTKGLGYKKGTIEQLMDIYMEEPKGIDKERILYKDYDEFPGMVVKNINKADLLNRFLIERKIDKIHCIRDRCRMTEGIGKYPHRLIIPIQDEMANTVGWQGKDMTGKAKTTYVNPPHFPIHEYMYELYLAYDGCLYLIICEGVFDTWRLDIMCENMGWEYAPVASFGNKLSKEQKIKLYKHIKENKINGIIFAWDSDAYYSALKEAEWFSVFCKSKAVRFPEGEDPDSYGAEKTLKLIEDTPWL